MLRVYVFLNFGCWPSFVLERAGPVDGRGQKEHWGRAEKLVRDLTVAGEAVVRVKIKFGFPHRHS